MTQAARTEIAVEGRLKFAFDGRWLAVKWDDSAAYRDGLAQHQGTQAVDIIAAVDAARLWLIEVKDPRGHRTEFAEKAADLHRIVHDKARDTLAAAIWSLGRTADAEVEQLMRVWHANREQKVGVALWWEGAEAAAASECTTRIQSELRWLNPMVVVTNRSLLHVTRARGLLAGMSVESLPGAPPAR